MLEILSPVDALRLDFKNIFDKVCPDFVYTIKSLESTRINETYVHGKQISCCYMH